nr:hypothetical protein GCM10020092_054820 [Actinoplanes digitatis]
MIGTEEATRHEGRMSAATMAHVVAADPQFQVPVRPCLVPGLVRVALDDGMAFVGSGNRQSALRGRTATTLIPRLLPALDGTRTVEELAALHTDVSERTIRACVSLLYISGLLQDGPAERGGRADPERGRRLPGPEPGHDAGQPQPQRGVRAARAGPGADRRTRVPHRPSCAPS